MVVLCFIAYLYTYIHYTCDRIFMNTRQRTNAFHDHKNHMLLTKANTLSLLWPRFDPFTSLFFLLYYPFSSFSFGTFFTFIVLWQYRTFHCAHCQKVKKFRIKLFLKSNVTISKLIVYHRGKKKQWRKLYLQPTSIVAGEVIVIIYRIRFVCFIGYYLIAGWRLLI
jgi:hypothetical protein